MRFEATTRIDTDADIDTVFAGLLASFKSVARYAQVTGKTIKVTAIEATFGSANRSDETLVSIAPAEGGFLVKANVRYVPSFWFWVFFLVMMFTWVGWLIPLFFYLNQKGAVRSAVEKTLNNVKNEFDRPRVAAAAVTPIPTLATELEALSRLKDQGILTEAEFTAKKTQLLGL